MSLVHIKRGFTLVEMLVSLALFTIVATIAVGTLLVLIGGNTRVVDEQAGMTALTFALDSMTREIRTGSLYHCNIASVVKAESPSVPPSVRDCVTGSTGLSFREAGGSITNSAVGRIAYFFENGRLYRKVLVSGGGPAEPITPEEIRLEEVNFFVTGTQDLLGANNREQPTVTIVLRAQSSSSPQTFTLQTTVTQRILDI
jgi:prepilin-type N-terminal cleavage/methylation domain-containing protein